MNNTVYTKRWWNCSVWNFSLAREETMGVNHGFRDDCPGEAKLGSHRLKKEQEVNPPQQCGDHKLPEGTRRPLPWVTYTGAKACRRAPGCSPSPTFTPREKLWKQRKPNTTCKSYPCTEKRNKTSRWGNGDKWLPEKRNTTAGSHSCERNSFKSNWIRDGDLHGGLRKRSV